MSPDAPHIPFPVASAALHAERLAWLLEHAGQISMDRDFEIAVCELISRKDPEHLLPGSAEFAERLVALSEQQGVDQ
jgi:hypothetical protein